MKTMAFDTLEFAKKLKGADFTERQAETLTQAMAGMLDAQLATKGDLQELEMLLKRDLQELELRMKSDLEIKLASVKTDLIKWIVGLFFAQVALFLTFFKILK